MWLRIGDTVVNFAHVVAFQISPCPQTSLSGLDCSLWIQLVNGGYLEVVGSEQDLQLAFEQLCSVTEFGDPGLAGRSLTVPGVAVRGRL